MFSLKKIALSAGILMLGSCSVYAELIGYWNFDDATGSGTATNAVSNTVATAYQAGGGVNASVAEFGTEGKFGTAVHMNNGYLQLTNPDSSVNIGQEYSALYNGDFTVNLWVKADSFQSGSTWTPLFADWSSPWSYMYAFNSQGRFWLYLSTPNDKTSTSATTGHYRADLYSPENKTAKVGEWVMLTIERDYDAGTFKQYMNGELTGTLTQDQFKNSPLMNYTAIQFGVKGDDLNNTFHGAFDEARIYNNLLGKSDIYSLYKYNDTEHKTIFLNNLLNNGDFASAMNGETARGAYDAANSTAVETVRTGSMVGTFSVTGTDSGIKIQLPKSLHGDLDYKRDIRNGQCAEDSTSLVGPAGYDYFGGIGMHANGMVTYNLNEIREGLGVDSNMTLDFSTTAAMANCSTAGNASADIYSLILLSNDEGLVSAYLQGEEVGFHFDEATQAWSLDAFNLDDYPEKVSASNKALDIAFPIFSDADYLSLFLLSGSSGSCDHAMYLNPAITAVPEPGTWALLLTGLLGIGYITRRHSTKK
ncbi:MAG: LamG-like jellyroll fold domain-containing protein [Planctomycetia bacterium]|nr:LamG-like jellyroll fold domain-containing protein [Planctomycetia bacterium]